MKNLLGQFLCVLGAAAALKADFNYNLSPDGSASIAIEESYIISVEAEETEFNSACAVTVYRNGSYFASDSPSGALNTAWETSGAGYFFAEFSSGNGDNGTDSFTMDLLPDTTAPTTPTGLSASSLAETSFLLTWAPSIDAWGVTGYEVKRDSTSLGTASGASRSITGLSANVTYQFSVRARDAAENWSAWSSAFAVTPPDQTAPSAPSSLASTGQTAASIALSWSGSTDNIGVVAYDVYRTRNGVTNLVPPATTSLTFTDSHVLPGTSYTYVVKARDAAGNSSSASNSIAATTTALSDTDSDGIPSAIESLFSNSNPTTDTALSLKTHRPLQ